MSTQKTTTAGARTQRPEGVTDEHLQYLDELRKSGVTNMFGAGEYVEREFVLDKQTARKILGYWMQSFGKEDR